MNLVNLEGRTIAITGAGRGLGAALAMVLADLGARPILLGRNTGKLDEIAARIAARGGAVSAVLRCDLGDHASCRAAAGAIAQDHPDCDGLIHNGAMWGEAALADLPDSDIATIIGSATTGAMVLTRDLVPALKARPQADVLIVGSITGLQNVMLRGASSVFKAAKAAQIGFAEGLTEELMGTSVRVSIVHPGFIHDVMPDEPGWTSPRGAEMPLTNREVVDAITYMLSAPPNVTLRSLTIERSADLLLRTGEGR